MGSVNHFEAQGLFDHLESLSNGTDSEINSAFRLENNSVILFVVTNTKLIY